VAGPDLPVGERGAEPALRAGLGALAARTEAAEADRWAAEKRALQAVALYLFLHFGALLLETALGTWGA
jgi:protoheme IX farnesyltransferase